MDNLPNPSDANVPQQINVQPNSDNAVTTPHSGNDHNMDGIYAYEEFYAGSLPPPADLEHYGKIRPEIIDWYLRMAEKDMEHRLQMVRNEEDHQHQIDKDKLWSSFKIERMGQIFAFTLILAALVAVIVSGVYNLPHATIPSTIVALAGLAAVLLNRRK